MSPEEFQTARIVDLARKTGIGQWQWCRYLNGKVFPRYQTLQKASADLNMKVPTLVECIELRVKNNLCINAIKKKPI